MGWLRSVEPIAWPRYLFVGWEIPVKITRALIYSFPINELMTFIYEYD